jgi:tRNA 2-selenouridine synthase SelU
MTEEITEEEIYEAGSFIVNYLNKLDNKKRIEFLKANVGAILSLTNVSDEEREKIIEEVKQELLKKKNNPSYNPSYIG